MWVILLRWETAVTSFTKHQHEKVDEPKGKNGVGKRCQVSTIKDRFQVGVKGGPC